ncbi:MAG: NADPH:quinone oxidoreductase, partial [Ramlibacter sp.]|nr:NADPH:quinone oxidoreductase [Ramlibacter sp.]
GASAWAAAACAGLEPGMRVLVHGGSGAVGALVVQHARSIGVEVAATCHSSHREHTLAQGAQRAIAYDTEDFGSLRGQDVVFDFVGGETHARTYAVLKPGGRIVYLVAAPFEDRSVAHGVTLTRATVSDQPEVLQAVARAAEAGTYRPLVSGTLPLCQAAMAHEMLETGQVRRGRIVLSG